MTGNFVAPPKTISVEWVSYFQGQMWDIREAHAVLYKKFCNAQKMHLIDEPCTVCSRLRSEHVGKTKQCLFAATTFQAPTEAELFRFYLRDSNNAR